MGERLAPAERGNASPSISSGQGGSVSFPQRGFVIRDPRRDDGDGDLAAPTGSNGNSDEQLSQGMRQLPVDKAIFSGLAEGVFGFDYNDGMTKDEWLSLAMCCLAMFGCAGIVGIIGGALSKSGVWVGAWGVTAIGCLALAVFAFSNYLDPPQKNYARVVRLPSPQELGFEPQEALPYPWCEIDTELRKLACLSHAHLNAKEREQGARLAGDIDWEFTHRAVVVATSRAIRNSLKNLSVALDSAAEYIRAQGDVDLTDAELPANMRAKLKRFETHIDPQRLGRLVASGGLLSSRLATMSRDYGALARRSRE